MAVTGRTFAWLNLAWNFGRHVVIQLPVRLAGRSRDAQRFRDAVIPEGYVPLDSDERAAMPSFMRCINCGLCSLACPDIAATSLSAWQEAWTFVAGPARSIDRAAAVTADMTPCADCRQCAAVCPTGVPIPQLAATLRRLASSACIALTLSTFAADLMAQQPARPRARDAGVSIGVFEPGTHNAITDVEGVRVGHTTVRGANGHTGVTAILPPGNDWFRERVPAAVVVGNGFGKLLGVTQIRELGELETPILLTCTLCVWRAADAMVDWLLARPGMENVRSINAVVGETNDGALNDIRARPITRDHVAAALEGAAAGLVEEGSVGAGAGTVAFGWKGGIGTSSRALPGQYGGYTVGVLVQSNYGGILTINGAPVGRELGRVPFRTSAGPTDRDGDPAGSVDGSIMIIVATDAPLDAGHLERLGRRALFGLARTGATMSNGSGDYVIAFSTSESVRRHTDQPSQQVTALSNESLTPLFQAVAEATEEAIVNSLFRANSASYDGRDVEALPIDRVLQILDRYRAR